MYKRILVSHLRASFLKLPLTLPGVPPCRLASSPYGWLQGYGKSARAVAAACWGPWRPMRFCCRPLCCPSITLIFISHQVRKMQKGERSSTIVETAHQASEGGKERGKGWGMEAEVEIKNRPCVSLFGLSWDPGCTKSHSCHFVWFFSPPCLLLPNAHFCFAQCSVQGQAMGFLHSGVLITGSHVSCSHLFPPLPHLFIFFPLNWYPLSFPLWTYGLVFKRDPSPHQRLRLSGSICCSFPQLFPLH